jgi:hypothetical protein
VRLSHKSTLCAIDKGRRSAVDYKKFNILNIFNALRLPQKIMAFATEKGRRSAVDRPI